MNRIAKFKINSFFKIMISLAFIILICTIGEKTAQAAISISPPTYCQVGSWPGAVAAGDFNNDGKNDLIVLNGNSHSYSVLLGDGKFGFTRADYDLGDYCGPSGIAVFDFNGDGNLDFVVSKQNCDLVELYYGKGDGTFTSASSYNVNKPQGIAIGDFNKDGYEDIAVGSYDYASSSHYGVYVIFGKDGSTDGKLFNDPVPYLQGHFVYKLTVGDFNNDGYEDIAAAEYDNNNVAVLLNDHNGSFTSPSNNSFTDTLKGIASGDFNGDGKCDLAAITCSTDAYVLLGNGDGTFDKTQYDISNYSLDVSVNDINNDGKMDIIMSTYSGCGITILEGNGDGTFKNYVTIPCETSSQPDAVTCSDFDGDGAVDIAVAEQMGGKVAFFRNTMKDAIANVQLSSSENKVGTASTVNVSVTTNGIPDNSTVTAEFLHSDGTELNPAISISGSTLNNNAVLKLDLSDTLPLGKYIIRVKAANNDKSFDVPYLIYDYGSIVWNNGTNITVSEDVGTVELGLSRTGGSKGDVTIMYTLGGTAVKDVDYKNETSGIGWLFYDGNDNACGTIKLGIINDGNYTGDRTIIVGLTENDGSPVILPGNVTITIKDNGLLDKVLDVSINAGTQAGTTADPKQASINVPYNEAAITKSDIISVENTAVTFYGTDSTFNTEETGSISLTPGTVTDVYIGITPQNGTMQYYKVTINRSAPVLVTGVSLNNATMTLTAGGANGTLSATVLPDNATDKNVTWSSDKPDIASVDQNGVVTPKAAGTAVITVTTEDGNKTAACTVTVNAAPVSVTGVNLNKTTMTLTAGGANGTLSAAVLPDNASDKNVTWSSDKPDIASVDQNGVVTPKAAGTAVITVTAEDGNKTAACTVMVNAAPVSVTGVSLNNATMTLTAGGANGTLSASILPDDATDKNVTWSSDKPDIASVGQNGTVTPVSAGTAVITVTTEDGNKTASCTVTVVPQWTSPITTPTQIPTDEKPITTTEITVDKVTGTITEITKTTQTDSNGNTVEEINTVIKSKNGKVIEEIKTINTLDKETGAVINTTINKVENEDGTSSITSANAAVTPSAENVVIEGDSAIINVSVPSKELVQAAEGEPKDIPLKVDIKLPELVKEQIESGKAKTVDLTVTIPGELANDEKVNISMINLENEIFKAAKESGTDIKVTIKDENGREAYSWDFSADELKASNKTVNDVNIALKVMELKDVPLKAIKEMEEKDSSMSDGLVINFDNSGILPAEASVRVYVGNMEGIKPGSKIHMYYYNSETNKLDELPDSVYIVDKDGYITVKITHCSYYVLLLNTPGKNMITELLDQVTVTAKTGNLFIGETKKITVKLPSTIDNTAVATYMSSNAAVASVSSGVITARKAGTAVIKTIVTLKDGTKKIFNTNITVCSPYINLIAPKTVIYKNKTYVYRAICYGLNSKIVWKVSNNKIAVINSKTGLFKAIRKGKVTVTAIAGNLTKSFTVIVK